MQAYTAAKTRILSHQNANDWAVLGRDDPVAWDLADQVKGRLLSFGWQAPPTNQSGTFLEDQRIYLRQGGKDEYLLGREDILLRGDHNVLNVLAACAVAGAAGWQVEAMRAGVVGFSGVEHRLEFVRTWGGAEWYNDSIATAPERTMAAIQAFEEPLVLLVGGRDKNLPWQELAALIRQRVDHLVVFGELADLIAKAVGPVKSNGRLYTIERAAGLREAVQMAAQVVEPGDVVLLSPGGTSFDEFKDFAQRGEYYRRWVEELP
jgi:UDP-N-acetylmuramoylalanine--D-glutamate ligase